MLCVNKIMKSQIKIPDFLTHYYRNPKGPFLCLTDLDDETQKNVIAKMRKEHTIGPWRFSDPNYIQECIRVNELVRDKFITKGGKPKRKNPHCAVLGTSSWMEEIVPDIGQITIPLARLRSEIVSFTYPDAGVSFYFVTHKPEDVKPYLNLKKPFHEKVFRLEELKSVAETYGLPGERWRDDKQFNYHYYIEAQIWDDEPLQEYIKKIR
jgi:hypothetical protein